ncbi:hypothetical protein V5H40_27160, partial [Salmonella enterica]
MPYQLVMLVLPAINAALQKVRNTRQFRRFSSRIFMPYQLVMLVLPAINAALQKVRNTRQFRRF